MMDARQEAPVAPLLVVDAGKETSLENRAFTFERGEGRRDRTRLKPERRGERRRRDRSKTLEPATQDLDQGAVRRPCFASLFGGRRNLRLEPRLRPNAMELSEPLGRNPQRRVWRLQERDAFFARQRRAITACVRRSSSGASSRKA